MARQSHIKIVILSMVRPVTRLQSEWLRMIREKYILLTGIPVTFSGTEKRGL
jgi:hypothetical protein